MTLKKRIDELEKKTGSKEPIWIIVVCEGAEPTEAQKEARIADYKAKHPDWQGRDFNVIRVINEHAKELTERLLAGERR